VDVYVMVAKGMAAALEKVREFDEVI